jgi:hypothetical protein
MASAISTIELWRSALRRSGRLIVMVARQAGEIEEADAAAAEDALLERLLEGRAR